MRRPGQSTARQVSGRFARRFEPSVPLGVTNAGSLSQRYAAASVTTEDVLAADLELTIKSGLSNLHQRGVWH